MFWALTFIVPTFHPPLIVMPPVFTNDPPVIAFDAVVKFDDEIDALVILAHVNEPELLILPF